MERYTSGVSSGWSSAHLRKVLNVMFPSDYIKLYHQPPNAVCSLLNTRCWPPTSSPGSPSSFFASNQAQKKSASYHLLEASTEPTSRSNLITLRQHLNDSLVEHQAKPVGLCPVRRAIYDQCFDELIRQVTVGCIEQGLLLFRIRSELRMTLNYYRKAYESGVEFGLNKTLEAKLKLNRSRVQIKDLEESRNQFNSECQLSNRISDIEMRNKLESVDKMKEYYKAEISKKDQVIEQQRAIIKALSQKFTGDIKSPI